MQERTSMFKQYQYSDIDNVAFELLNEKAVIIPTDTIIGIMSKNVNLIYEIKERSRSKQIIVFLPDHSYLTDLDSHQKEFINKFWPGPITIIKNGISYRIPNDKYILYLLNKVGPLYCSSANKSGDSPITQTYEANSSFDSTRFFHQVVIVAGKQLSNVPSTIVDIDKWIILREGAMFNDVQSFIMEKEKQTRHIYILLDKVIFDRTKTIKKELNYTAQFLKLTNANLHKILNNPNFIKDNSDLLIVTDNPSDYDYAANKIKSIRSGIVFNTEVSSLLKRHDNTNVAIFDLNTFNLDEIIVQMNSYLSASFEGGRHEERVQTIIDYEENN